MHRTRAIVLGAATLVAAFGLSGCTTPGPPAATPTSAVSAALPPPAPLPDPAALTDVLARLSDPAIPGNQKLPLVEGSSEADVAGLDSFARALADNHMLPLTIEADELAWSARDPANVTATVSIQPADTEPEDGFSFPMEFTPAPGGWRLSRKTADLLMTLGTPAPEAPVAPAGPVSPVPAAPPR